MRNNFSFTAFTATAAVGLGLFLAGCADGGGGTVNYPYNPAPAPTPSPEPSPTPSPEPGEKATLKMEFDIATARAEVPAEVTAYNFRLNIGEEESQAEEGVEKKADDDNPSLQTVTIENVDPAVDNVRVEYLNDNGKVIAMSEFAVELAAGQETEANDFECLEASSLVISSDPGFAYVGEDIELTASVIYGDAASDDFIMLELANDEVTWELTAPEIAPGYDVGDPFPHCFKAKDGEAGVFTAIEQDTVTDYAKATYADGIAGGFLLSAVPAGAEFEYFGFMPFVISDLWSYELAYGNWVISPDSEEETFKSMRLGYAEKTLPESFAGPMSSELFELMVLGGAHGINSNVFYFAGSYSYTDKEGNPAKAAAFLNASEWSGEGDFYSVQGFGQRGTVTVTGMGTGGTVSAMYDGKEVSVPLETLEAEPVILPAAKSESDEIFEYPCSAYPLYDAYPSEYDEDGLYTDATGTVQLCPAASYKYEYDGNVVLYGMYVDEDADAAWEKTSGNDKFSIDENGLVTINGASVGDKATFMYSLDGYEPAETLDLLMQVEDR